MGSTGSEAGMSIQIKQALVTGGAGFIGSHLVDALLENGCMVRVIDDLSTGRLSNLKHIATEIDFIEGDIRDLKQMQAAVKGCDVVFHQAAVVSVPQTVEDPIYAASVNDAGTITVLEAARMAQVRRVVLASSCAVYGDDPENPKHEKMLPKPKSPYAIQKLGNELYARLYDSLHGLATVCLRYFNVYGPRQDPSSPYSGVISIFMTRAAEKKQPIIHGDGTQYRDFIFVKDVVHANLLAAEVGHAHGEVFNVGIAKCVSINKLWEIISDIFNIKIKPMYEEMRPGDIKEVFAQIGKIEATLGFKPRYTFEEGLRLTYEWYGG
jgi:UDP-glucose 4-epimerase